MQTVSVQQRRQAIVSRHFLAGDADGPEDVTRALVALHATDPATVYLSVLARSSASTLSDIAEALYDTRSLVRWLAMRRTLFVVARDDVPVLHAAVGTALARSLRTQLINRLDRVRTEPPINGDTARWLDDVGESTVDVLRRRSAATGVQLAVDEPRLRTAMQPRAPSERAQNLTTSLLTLLGAQGRIVRGNPTGTWTSRQHLWEPVELRWPNGLPSIDPDDARRRLATRWLEGFGPATVDDLQWWTGWPKTLTRRVLTGLNVAEVDLHGRPGITLPGTDLPVPTQSPVAALLPALDPTPMGWKSRDWFFDIDQRHVFDSAGNIGPTVWWNGRIIGSWAIAADGEIRMALLADHGRDAANAARAAADSLQARLAGAVVTPAARTPLERDLAQQHDSRQSARTGDALSPRLGEDGRAGAD